MRRLNARMWSGTKQLPSDPVKLGGCGRICEGGSWVPVFAADSRWLPGSLAVCENALLCDFCGPRRQAQSAARFQWHFTDWLNSGGQLVHIRLSVPHQLTDSLSTLLTGLKKAEATLRTSGAWKRAGIVDWVRVLHVRWSPATGWHPHYHVVAFIPAGRPVGDGVEAELSAAWRQQVAKAGFGRTAGRRGLFARVVADVMRALYAWHWATDDDSEEDDDDRYHPMADTVDDDDRYHPMSMSLAGVATAALSGDRQAWAVWMEAGRALKGVPVVRASRVLDRLWAIEEAAAGPEAAAEGEAEPLGDPVVLVGATLWERARREGCTGMGLAVGREFGAEAMARWWAERMGVRVRVASGGGGPPKLSMVATVAAAGRSTR